MSIAKPTLTLSHATPEQRAEAATALFQSVRAFVGGHVLGQHDAVELLLTALLAGGHALLVGVPGVAKTLLIRTLAQGLQLPFRRIQFTPDLMPSDILGSDMLEGTANEGMRLTFSPGPIFASLVLADEINRTPPKTQAALLECMQEKSVTVGGHVHALPTPFHVFATQNPIEQEGTYPLPEAQLDRFLLAIAIGYPDEQTELRMARGEHHRGDDKPAHQGKDIARALTEAQGLVDDVPVPAPLLTSAVRIVRGTRPAYDDASPAIRRLLSFGAGPRATQALLKTARAHALVKGRTAVTEEDIRLMLHPVLGHRLLLSAQGEMEAGGAPDQLLRSVTDDLTQAHFGRRA